MPITPFAGFCARHIIPRSYLGVLKGLARIGVHEGNHKCHHGTHRRVIGRCTVFRSGKARSYLLSLDAPLTKPQLPAGYSSHGGS